MDRPRVTTYYFYPSGSSDLAECWRLPVQLLSLGTSTVKSSRHPSIGVKVRAASVVVPYLSAKQQLLEEVECVSSDSRSRINCRRD